jgi:hypothetical protein
MTPLQQDRTQQTSNIAIDSGNQYFHNYSAFVDVQDFLNAMRPIDAMHMISLNNRKPGRVIVLGRSAARRNIHFGREDSRAGVNGSMPDRTKLDLAQFRIAQNPAFGLRVWRNPLHLSGN